MSIPDIEAFNAFLGSLTLDQPLDSAEYDRFEAIPPRIVVDGDGGREVGALWLWYSKSSRLTPSSCIERIRKELQAKNHAATRDVALVILVLLSITERHGSAVSRLNAITATIVSAQSSQFLIAPFPPPPSSGRFTIGPFGLGLLNREGLVFQCEKVGCDFFKRYPREYSNRFAVERVGTPTRVLDWARLYESLVPQSQIAGILGDYYFDTVSSELREDFCAAFENAQEVLVAAGAPYVNIRQITAWAGGAFVCIYRDIGQRRNGYFCPSGIGARLDFAQADRRFPETAERLRRQYGFSAMGPHEVHKALDTYCRFVKKAKVYEVEGRDSEAFLHYVIALDLLFGERDESTKRITKRVALIVSRPPAAQLLAGNVERLRWIYDRRSRYVHAGESAGSDALEAVRPISTAVLDCLLRLQSAPANRADGFVERWLRTIDFLVAGIEAGRVMDDAELAAAGLEVADLASTDPTQRQRRQ